MKRKLLILFLLLIHSILYSNDELQKLNTMIHNNDISQLKNKINEDPEIIKKYGTELFNYAFTSYPPIKTVPAEILAYLYSELLKVGINVVENDPYITPLMKYSAIGLIDKVNEELKKNININQLPSPDIDGLGSEVYPAISYASKFGHIEIVKLLVKNGSNVNFNNPWHCPLQIAMRYNQFNIAEYLINQGADPNTALNFGRLGLYPPLRFALEKENIKIIKLLIDKNVNIYFDYNNEYINNAIELIKKKENKELIKIFNEAEEKGFVLYPEIIEATSYLTEGKITYNPEKLHDLKSNTSYVESEGNDGKGTVIHYIFKKNVSIKKAVIYNGFQENAKLFLLNNRVKLLQIEIFKDNKQQNSFTISIQDKPEKQIIDLIKNTDKPLIGNKIQITIKEIYKGTKFNDTCLSEINFIGKLEE